MECNSFIMKEILSDAQRRIWYAVYRIMHLSGASQKTEEFEALMSEPFYVGRSRIVTDSRNDYDGRKTEWRQKFRQLSQILQSWQMDG